MRLLSLRRRRNPLARKFSCCVGGPNSFGQAQGLPSSRHQTPPPEGNKVYVLAGDVSPELAQVEPAEESWTRLDDGDQVEQDQADQLEELKRVSAARQLSWLERQKPSQMNHALVKAKGTGAQHRRQTIKGVAKQEQDGPRIYSDFFHMSEAGVSTRFQSLHFSSSVVSSLSLFSSPMFFSSLPVSLSPFFPLSPLSLPSSFLLSFPL